MKNKRMFKCISSKSRFPQDWAFNVGGTYELHSENSDSDYVFKLRDDEGGEFYFNAPKKSFEEVKKIIGYKLVKPEYESAVTNIIWNDSRELNLMKGVHFENDSIGKHRLEEAWVLDLWFEPVYEETVKIPKINGVELEVKGNYIFFGEYSLPRECFNSTPGTGIEYLCLEKDRFFIGGSEMNEIREYLKKI